MRVANPADPSGGDFVLGTGHPIRNVRGDTENPYQLSLFTDLPEGQGGGTRPMEPDQVRGRRNTMDMATTLNPGLEVARAINPIADGNNNTAMHDQIALNNALHDA